MGPKNNTPITKRITKESAANNKLAVQNITDSLFARPALKLALAEQYGIEIKYDPDKHHEVIEGFNYASRAMGVVEDLLNDVDLLTGVMTLGFFAPIRNFFFNIKEITQEIALKKMKDHLMELVRLEDELPVGDEPPKTAIGMLRRELLSEVISKGSDILFVQIGDENHFLETLIGEGQPGLIMRLLDAGFSLDAHHSNPPVRGTETELSFRQMIAADPELKACLPKIVAYHDRLQDNFPFLGPQMPFFRGMSTTPTRFVEPVPRLAASPASLTLGFDAIAAGEAAAPADRQPTPDAISQADSMGRAPGSRPDLLVVTPL